MARVKVKKSHESLSYTTLSSFCGSKLVNEHAFNGHVCWKWILA